LLCLGWGNFSNPKLPVFCRFSGVFLGDGAEMRNSAQQGRLWPSTGPKRRQKTLFATIGNKKYRDSSLF
jgi:hypothetical protein